MADIADYSDEKITNVVNDELGRISRKAAQIPQGNPGECDLCGEHSGRLIDGACSPCRDRYRLP